MTYKTAYRLITIADENNAIDIDKASQLLGVSTSTVKKYVQQLINEGFVEKTKEGKYVLTRLGVSIKKVMEISTSKNIPNYVITDVSTGQPIPLSFNNYEQLYAVITYQLAPREVLEHHLRNYLPEWVRSSIGDELLAEKISKGEINSIEDLKKYLEFILSITSSLTTR
ncbi:MarR family transcriptional regulator [Thermosphaera chiliense]|uniref:MarR family transcriptional regulator n=1 Tax=Thermosphaera chiliense TaxID=3402707 RepID=A0A7M1USA9_9CREN|nr:MarR family transcriptional regulator [Thermosphaera aggregans]QOR93902.1 MarR family transcriptional regulator [Thermosphaera aggregans]